MHFKLLTLLLQRKRRPTQTLLRHNDKYVHNKSKENLVEYQPQNDTDFDYDKYEEADLDYVVEDLTSLVETKSDSSDMNSVLPVQKDDYIEDDDEDPLQTEYEQEQDYQRYVLRKNIASSTDNHSSKPHHSAQHIAVTTNGGDGTDAIIITDDAIHNQNVYEEDDSDTVATGAVVVDGVDNISADQWSQHLSLEPKHNLHICGDISQTTNDPDVSTSSKYKESPLMTTKFVRDVKTMTSPKNATCNQYNKLSQSSEIMAKSWAIQYEELNPEQKVFARKAINDILFEACMGHLSVGPNGRVVNVNNPIQNNHFKPAQNSFVTEVESGEVYEQASSTSATIAIVSPDNTTNDQWLKL